jgi:hypothetical protein
MDPEKIIKVWEGDRYKNVNGKIMRMRACDHKVIQDLQVCEFVPPDQQRVDMNILPLLFVCVLFLRRPLGEDSGEESGASHGSQS